jgi:hypothetical protein
MFVVNNKKLFVENLDLYATKKQGIARTYMSLYQIWQFFKKARSILELRFIIVFQTI